MVRIRTTVESDRSAVEQVLSASYPVLMAGAYDGALLARALPLMTRANSKLLTSGTYYLAESDGEPVGCGGWTFEEPGSGVAVADVAHIRHFAVGARFTGRGIGRALFERCARDARRSGVQRFECYASLNGERFYAALGFVAAGPINVPMGPHLTFPSIVMRRAI